MDRTLFTNVTIWTPGESPFAGDVLVSDGQVARVARQGGALSSEGCVVQDGAGATLMPGLIDGHGHLSFMAMANTVEFGLIPQEEHVLITMHNARRVLDAGFTSVLSGGSLKPRLDAVIRDEIAAGRIPGPRILASTPELTVTGGMGDESRMHFSIQTFCEVHDGADDFRRATRLHIREGADVLKVVVSGHYPVPGTRHVGPKFTPITDAELAAVTETARAFGKLTAAHARSDEAVRMCLRHGVDLIYHCEYSNEETLDLLEEAKDRIFLAPAMAPIRRTIENAEAAGNLDAVRAIRQQFEAICETYQKLRKRGLRILTGGDYGLGHCPHGTNARDIEYFVKFLGYGPAEVLDCATRFGAEAMRMGDQLGQVREGYVADLLLVRGAPYQDVTLLQDANNLLAIMQGGRFYKRPEQTPAGMSRAA